MIGRFSRHGRRAIREYSGLPVVALGIVFIVYGLARLVPPSDFLLIDLVVTALLEVLAIAIIYGGFQVSARGLSFREGIRVFVATVLFGLIGFVVASALIALQLSKGVAVTDIPFLIATATATTAALGVGLALYYLELRAERTALLAQHEQVANLNKRLTVLQRVLRHNLRNELTVIQGYTELLLDRANTEEEYHSLRTMLRHVDRIESLSEKASRLHRVWNHNTAAPQDVVPVVEECVREVETAEPDVDINTNLLDRAVVSVHPMFGQAVIEALQNAVIHNERGKTDITVAVERLVDERMDVEIRVTDTGGGIPELERKVLDLDEEEPLKHGTGLGIWLIYWIVDMSGGTLVYESNDQEGTNVRMQLTAPKA